MQKALSAENHCIRSDYPFVFIPSLLAGKQYALLTLPKIFQNKPSLLAGKLSELLDGVEEFVKIKLSVLAGK